MTSPIAPTFVNALDTNISLTTYPRAPTIGAFQPNTTDVRTAISNAAQFRLNEPINANFDFNITAPDLVINKDPMKGVNAGNNILNNFANYTYHIRFSMVNQEQAYNVVNATTDLSTVSRYIIAESGATAAFNISKFSTMNIVSPNFKNQNQGLMTWKMTINEPYGLTLPDYIVNAAKSSRIGIKNTSRFPFFIELWFTGYDEEGNIVEPSVTRKLWRVMMLDFDLETAITGTTYNLHGIADNAIGTANQYAFPKTSLELNMKGGTLGDAIDKFQEALDKASKDAENKNLATTYKIQIPNELRNWNFETTKKDTHSQITSPTNSTGGATIKINRGQDIGSFLLSLAGKCETDADNYLKGMLGGPDKKSAENSGLGRVLQVFTEVKLGEYMPDLNDYTKEIIVRMVPFYTPRIVSTPEQAKKQLGIEIQKRKVAELQKLGLLAKQYDYQYTGLNTEIIRFDVKVENFWAITLPTYLGTNTWAQSHIGPKFDGTSTGAARDRQTAIKFGNDNILPYSPIGDIANRVSSSVTSAFGSLGSAASSFGIGGIGSQFGNIGSAGGVFGTLSSSLPSGMNSTIQNLAINNIGNQGGGIAPSNLIRGLSSAIPNGILRFDAQSTNLLQNITNNVRQAGTFSNAASTAAEVASRSLAAGTRGLTYLEDVKSEIESLRTSEDDSLKVAFQVDPSPQGQNATNNGLEAKQTNPSVKGFPTGQTMFGQTIGNLYDNKFMLEIELTIRGDPYWMGTTNLEDNERSKTLLNLSNAGNQRGVDAIMRDRANYLLGENMFLLTFRTGSNYREDTGFMEFEKSSDYFNGIYAVLEVENKFENGSFTQDIRAYKELFSQKYGKELSTGKAMSDDQATQAVRAAPDLSMELQNNQRQQTADIPEDLAVGTPFG
jgi:hypothetical protein